MTQNTFFDVLTFPNIDNAPRFIIDIVNPCFSRQFINNIEVFTAAIEAIPIPENSLPVEELDTGDRQIIESPSRIIYRRYRQPPVNESLLP